MLVELYDKTSFSGTSPEDENGGPGASPGGVERQIRAALGGGGGGDGGGGSGVGSLDSSMNNKKSGIMPGRPPPFQGVPGTGANLIIGNRGLGETRGYNPKIPMPNAPYVPGSAPPGMPSLETMNKWVGKKDEEVRNDIRIKSRIVLSDKKQK
jgi:hypothetical protein